MAVAYQAESDLLALLRPHYARVDQEGRTLLHELFATAGDIRLSDSELNITLAPLGSPHRTHAAQALCVTRRQHSSRVLACGSASQCISRGASGMPSAGLRSSEAPRRMLPRRPDRRRNRTFWGYPMSGGLNLSWSEVGVKQLSPSAVMNRYRTQREPPDCSHMLDRMYARCGRKGNPMTNQLHGRCVSGGFGTGNAFGNVSGVGNSVTANVMNPRTTMHFLPACSDRPRATTSST